MKEKGGKPVGIENAPMWLWIIVIFLGIVLIISGTIKTSYKNLPQKISKTNIGSIYQGPSPVINIITFPDGIDRQEFELISYGWVKVITPLGSKFHIDSPSNTDICFINGTKIKDGPDKANWVGSKIGNDIFWMKAPRGKATVIIER